MKNVDNENPYNHWEYVNVENKIVVDLGCGRWEKVEYRDPSWPTTPEYFKIKGASCVVGMDSDPEEIKWFKSNFNLDSSFQFIEFSLQSSNDFKEIIEKIKPNCIKCDIEGGEIHLINLADEIFKMVDEYYIETHNQELYLQCINKLLNCNYTIVEQIDLIHTNGACKVIFGKK
jgi:hypothetical protein